MSLTCREAEPLLLDRAAGALDPAQQARLAAHLIDCAACRAEAEALDRTVELVRLPPPDAAEEAALAGLADQMAGARAAAARRRSLRFRVGAALAAAAAVALFISAPAFTRRAPRLDPADLAAAAGVKAPAAWQAPDPDELYRLAERALPDGDGASGVASAAAAPSTGSELMVAAAESWAELLPDVE